MNMLWIALLTAYLLGSLPFAYWIAHSARGIDPRTVGDGNLGAKNVFLNVGHTEGLLVGLLDIGKGTAAITLARALDLDLAALLMVGLAAVLGHNWSLFLHLQGGQGMATTVGVLLALLPRETLLGILVIALVLVITRHWDFACSVGLALIPVAAWQWEHNAVLTLYPVALLPLIGVRKWMQMTAARWEHRRRM
jgi:glycerol-3-phosphate acyltransferase PlsY